MNSWKEAPHLFCNGKFRVLINDGYSDLYEEDIIGINFDAVSTETCDSIQLNECEALIARPISDMSDEEVRTYSDNWIGYEKEGRSAFIDLCDGVMPARLFLYLLSIGVYPFDQNHNDIIWRYENPNS